MICSTGLTVPSAFDSAEIATILVRGESSRPSASMSSSPESNIGMTRSVAPFSSHSICHGTMFEWCSMAEMTISSPAVTLARPMVCATRLIPSVALRVKITSLGSEAPMNVAMRWRAPSNRSVAFPLRWCTPRCTLALLDA
jgi:hypothetical protein